VTPFTIATSVREAMVAHARRDAPRECCGLLIGRGRRVDLAMPLANVARRPRTRFQVDPGEHIAVRRVLRHVAPALEIVGLYHSHPDGPAVPSARDVAEAHYPDWLFVIVGRGGRSVRAYQIRKESAVNVAVRWRSPGRGRRRA
jgi:proteasome lid subunit RPN8/RPN11